MGYFNCANSGFSEGQMDIINTDLNNRISTGNIQLPSQNFPGTVGPINGLLIPGNGEVISNNANIFFDWEDAENVEKYLIEVDFVPTFSFHAKFGEEVLFQLDASNHFEGDIQIYSTSGQLVSALGTQQFAPGENVINLQNNQWTRGIYFVRVLAAEGTYQQKVIIQ